METDYDVVVVGAGPAGSTCAKVAAEKGCRVLLIEKRQEIGVPVRCGEGVSKKIEELNIKIPKYCIAQEVKGARIFAPNGKFIELSEKVAGGEVGYNIYRDKFDKELAVRAAKAGCDIQLKTSAVGVLKENGKVVGIKAKHMGDIFNIPAKLVVAADGFESQLPRWSGIDTSLKPNDIVACLQYTMVNIDFDSDYNNFYLGSHAPGGYAWLFPRGDECNVGLGVALNKIKECGEVKKCIDKFVAQKFNKGKIIRIVAGAVSTSQPIEKTVADGIIVAGDSARLIDPITGGGIFNACLSGIYAGEVAAKAIECRDYSENVLQEYEKLWRAKLEDKHYRNWLVKEKLSKLSDEKLNKGIEALAEFKFEEISTLELIKAVQEKYPELLKELEELLVL
ncbi:MAG: NAD(P)/FAD-dependent oxidoreductase [Candidatus Thermoplasmatota archaeon]|nr:NAD(P)/FAD-dependent oxidoreductase [Candidatus Thermoplasmatota archaeon]